MNPTTDVFRAKVRATYNLELFTAKKNEYALITLNGNYLFLSFLEPPSHDL